MIDIPFFCRWQAYSGVTKLQMMLWKLKFGMLLIRERRRRRWVKNSVTLHTDLRITGKFQSNMFAWEGLSIKCSILDICYIDNNLNTFWRTFWPCSLLWPLMNTFVFFRCTGSHIFLSCRYSYRCLDYLVLGVLG